MGEKILTNRGDKLGDLVKRSEELSSTSKAFLGASRKANGCCAVV
jgi:hypothetical protein